MTYTLACRLARSEGGGSSWTETLRSVACETFFKKTCASLQVGAALETTHETWLGLGVGVGVTVGVGLRGVGSG